MSQFIMAACLATLALSGCGRNPDLPPENTALCATDGKGYVATSAGPDLMSVKRASSIDALCKPMVEGRQ